MNSNKKTNKMSIEYITKSVDNSTANTGTVNNPINISPDTHTWVTDTNKQYLIGKTDIMTAFQILKEKEKNLDESQKSLARYVPRDKLKFLYDRSEERKNLLNEAEADLIDVYSKNPTIDTTHDVAKFGTVSKTGVFQLDKTPNKQAMDVLSDVSTKLKNRSDFYEI